MTGKLDTDRFGNLPADREYGSLIFDAVREGMAPFHLKRVDIWMDFDIDYNEYRVCGAAVLMSGYTFNFPVRVNAWDLAGYPDREMRRAADEIFKAFRNREDIRGVPQNIVLGEY